MRLLAAGPRKILIVAVPLGVIQTYNVNPGYKMVSHTRKNMRKSSRKNMRKASRKSHRKSTRKTQAGGKRSAWLKKVMSTYKAMKAKNSKVTLKDAMKAAAKSK